MNPVQFSTVSSHVAPQQRFGAKDAKSSVQDAQQASHTENDTPHHTAHDPISDLKDKGTKLAGELFKKLSDLPVVGRFVIAIAAYLVTLMGVSGLAGLSGLGAPGAEKYHGTAARIAKLLAMGAALLAFFAPELKKAKLFSGQAQAA